VALLAANLVGPRGRVVGIDSDVRMVEHARRQAKQGNMGHVQFQEGSLLPGESLGRYDLVIGRLVTAVQPEPTAFLRHAASFVSPGGTIAVMEVGWNLCRTWTDPALPLYDDLIHQHISLIKKLGFDAELGSHLIGTFRQSGLAEPSLITELLVGGIGSGLLDFNLLTIDVMMAQAQKRGIEVPDSAEVEVTYAEIRRAATSSHVQVHGPCLVGAW